MRRFDPPTLVWTMSRTVCSARVPVTRSALPPHVATSCVLAAPAGSPCAAPAAVIAPAPAVSSAAVTAALIARRRATLPRGLGVSAMRSSPPRLGSPAAEDRGRPCPTWRRLRSARATRIDGRLRHPGERRAAAAGRRRSAVALGVALLDLGLQLRHHVRIAQRGHVTQLTTLGDVAQQPAHDL